MATITFFTYAKESKSAPVFVNLSAGRKAKRLIVRSGLFVDSERWSNKTQTIRQRTQTDTDKKLIAKVRKLRNHIETEFNDLYDTPTVDWLQSVVDSCFKKNVSGVNNLNDYILAYIQEAKAGEKKNNSGMNLSPGTIRTWEGFRRIFSEYQGVYSEKRIKELAEEKKKPRPLRTLNYDDITISFYDSFKAFLVNEGYAPNTTGRFIKDCKFFMQKSLNDKKHDNRDFQNKDHFKVLSEVAFTVSLNPEELDQIYKKDIDIYPRLKLARDKFLILAETALRVSDYKKVSLNIREVNGNRLIYITQQKTGGNVILPLTRRLEMILEKYDGNLPQISEQETNRNIKVIARMCGIDEVLRWEASKYGKKYQKTAHKWELISCHTARRSGCTNMFLAGIEPLKIMRLSGHKTEREFLKYIRITEEQIALELASHPYFNKLRVI